MTDVVVFGTGDMSEAMLVYLERHSDLNVVGFTLDAKYRKDDSYKGKPLVDWEDLERHYPPEQVQLFGPVTYRQMNTLRRDRFNAGKARGYRYASFIHPGAHVYAQSVGEHCIVMENSVLQPYSTLGDNCIIWSFNHIGHHSVVGAHVFMAGMGGVAGSAVVGDECYLGAFCGTGHQVKLGRGVALLNAAFAIKSQRDYAVLVGPENNLRPYTSERLHKLI